MKLVLLFAALFATGCTTNKETGEETAAEFGICYDRIGCPAGAETSYSVTKNQCDASGGKSWKGGTSGCKRL